MSRAESKCHECGMTVKLGEYHPYVACLMYKGYHDGEKVRANLLELTREFYNAGVIEGYRAAEVEQQCPSRKAVGDE